MPRGNTAIPCVLDWKGQILTHVTRSTDRTIAQPPFGGCPRHAATEIVSSIPCGRRSFGERVFRPLAEQSLRRRRLILVAVPLPARKATVFQKIAEGDVSKRRGVRLSEADRTQLQRWVRSRTLGHRTVIRSRIVLLAARGVPVSSIAADVRVAPATVRLWCRRFQERGITALNRDAHGRGRRPGMDRERVMRVLTARQRLDCVANPTARSVAAAAGTSATTVWRVWKRFGLNAASSSADIARAIGQLISETGTSGP